MTKKELTPDALRRAAQKVDDLRFMSKEFQHKDGAYWPAFYLSWAADEIENMEKYIYDHLFDIWPGGTQEAPEDDLIHEVSRKYSVRASLRSSDNPAPNQK